MTEQSRITPPTRFTELGRTSDYGDQPPDDTLTFAPADGSRGDGGPTWLPQSAYQMAQQMMSESQADADYAHIPAPAGAKRLGPWQQAADGGWVRDFDVEDLGDDVRVWIGGTQRSDGTEVRCVYVSDGDGLSASQARRLSQLLAKAADAIEAQ